jgi:hypothetical protein
LLKGVPKVSGSFLFWLIWMSVAILSMFVIFLRWREYPARDEGEHR